MIHTQHVPAKPKEYRIECIERHLEQAADLLKIPMPEIFFVPRMAQDDQDQLIITKTPYEDPENGHPGFHLIQGLCRMDSDGSIQIFVASHGDWQGPGYLLESQLLYISLHELRHAWQYTYDMMLEEPSDLEHMLCPCEIDADAFAVVYLRNRAREYRVSRALRGFDEPWELDDDRRIERANEIELELFPEIEG